MQQKRPYSNAREAAEYFGTQFKHMGWTTALPVAMYVDDGRSSHPDKVSAEAFAEWSGVAVNWVRRHLKAWNDAAADGRVPYSAELVPGQDVTLPEDEGGDAWRDYYKSQTALHVSEERKDRLEKAAKERGVGASKVKDIASNPKALAVAIIADDKSAAAAESALVERAKQKAAERHASEAQRPQRTPEEELAFQQAAAASFFEQKTWIERFRAHVVSLEQDARDWNEQQKLFMAEELEREHQRIGMMIDMLRGLDDSALALLIDGGR